jgi:hypothetical protein
MEEVSKLYLGEDTFFSSCLIVFVDNGGPGYASPPAKYSKTCPTTLHLALAEARLVLF